MAEAIFPRAVTAPLLRTKLLPPRPGAWIRRPRLFEAAAPSPGRVLVLTAGPGWGKTTLLRQLAAESALPTAWLRIDELDTDLAVFARHLIAALESAAGNPLESARATLLDHAASDRLPIQLAAGVAEDLAKHKERALLLVLDDMHYLPEGAPALRLLERLAGYASGNLALAVAGRSVPDLPVERWVSEGTATVLTAAELRCTPQEAQELASTIYHLRVSAPDLARIMRETGGWPVALNQLLESRQFGMHPAGDDLELERLLRYLQRELQSLPGPLRDFLLQTAILRRLLPEVCDQLAGVSASAPALLQLTALGFLRRDGDSEFRHEEVFRPLLQLWVRRQLSPAALKLLHRQAAEAWQRRGEPAEALEHLVEAGERTRAWALADETVRASHDLPCLQEVGPRALDLLLHAPGDMPWLHLNNAYLLLDAGRSAEALSAAGRAQRRLSESEASGRTAATLLRARALALLNRVEEAMMLLEQHPPADAGDRPLLRAHRLGLLALLSHLKDEPQRGDAYLAQVVSASRAAGSARATLRAFSDVAFRLYYARGDFTTALRYSRWLQAEVDGEMGDVPLLARGLTTLALVRAGRAAEAAPLARDLLAECRAAHLMSGRALALTALAAAQGCLGHPEEGARLATMAMEEARALSVAGLQGLVLDWAARLQRWSGDAASAVETAARLYHQVVGPGAPPVLRTAAAASLVLAHLAAGDAAAASQVLAEADASCPPQSDYYRVKLDLAWALLDNNPETAAARAARAAERLAQGQLSWLERYESEWVEPALARSGVRSTTTIKRRPATLSTPDAALPGVPLPALASLSEREEEIFKLMLRGASNREIARRLYISEGTVKSHSSSIFQKLGVHNRTQAVLLALQFARTTSH